MEENHMVIYDEEDYYKLYSCEEEPWDEEAAMEKYYSDKYGD